MDDSQRALAEAIRGEMASRTPRITAKAVYTAIGISSSSWDNYFVQCERDVPMSIVKAVAEVLGIPTSELLKRAEARQQAAPIPDEIASMLSKEARKVTRKPGRKARKDTPRGEAQSG